MSNETITINSEMRLAEAKRELDRIWRENKYVEVEVRRKAKQRTDPQRCAIELYCRNVADALNDAGWDQRAVFAQMRDGVELPWNQDRVKDDLWRKVQVALLNKTSTTRLTTSEVNTVYEPLSRWLAQTLGISVPFPSKEVAA